MFSTNALVSVYLDDYRPLPTEILFLVLEFSGLVRFGHRSVHFWVNWRRQPSAAKKRDDRSPSLFH